MHIPLWARESLPPPDANRSGELVACMTVTIAVAITLVALRVYVRARFVQAMGFDDWTIVLAMAFGIITLATDSVKVSHGFGRHIDYLTPEQQSTILKYSIIGTITLIISQGLAKISICFLLRRLLGDAVAPKRKMFIYGLIGFLAAYTLVVVIALLAQCHPTNSLWDRHVKGSCWDPRIVESCAIMHGVCSTVTAFVLSTLPVLILGSLQLNKRKKIAIMCVLGLGVFDGACSIVRLVHTPHFNQRKDFTWTQVPLYVWADLEQNFAIIAACIPTLRPLFRFLDQKRTGSSSNRRTYPSLSLRKHGLGNQGLPYQGRPELRDDEYALTEMERAVSDSDSFSSTAKKGTSASMETEARHKNLGAKVAEKIVKTTEITIRS